MHRKSHIHLIISNHLLLQWRDPNIMSTGNHPDLINHEHKIRISITVNIVVMHDLAQSSWSGDDDEVIILHDCKILCLNASSCDSSPHHDCMNFLTRDFETKIWIRSGSQIPSGYSVVPSWSHKERLEWSQHLSEERNCSNIPSTPFVHTLWISAFFEIYWMTFERQSKVFSHTELQAGEEIR